MDQGPLVTEQLDAGAKFLAEFYKTYAPGAAFWLQEAESRNWNLYVASDQINDDNFDEAYLHVAQLAAKLQDPWFDPFQVKVIGTDDPLAQEVMRIQKRYPGKMPTRVFHRQVAGVDAEEIIIYPQPATVPG